MSLFTCLYLPTVEFRDTDYYKFADSYLLKQSEAMVTGSYMEYETDAAGSILFNPNGNVQSARTIHFDHRKDSIVVELGGGRLVFKE